MRPFDPSRRLTGPNLLFDGEGAVLDVELAPEEADRAIAAWRAHARRLLDAVGWGDEELYVRRFRGGASLGFSAPFDALYAATEVNDEAWTATEATVLGLPGPDLYAAAHRLREEIAREENPALRALRGAATAHGVALLADDQRVSIGLGAGSRTWPIEEIPDPGAIDWREIHDVPVLLVTGTNGKTTTVRLLAAMMKEAGRVAGTTSTDRVEVGGEEVEAGDFSGPGGARTLLRDRRVEVAILETARGGMLRRGLAVRSADAALVTNVAADHLGELGVFDLDDLTDAKLVVTRVVKPGGRVVLNAQDPSLVARAAGLPAPVIWFGLGETPGEEAAFLEDGYLVLRKDGRTAKVVRVDEIPITFGGIARHNVANALAAVALASVTGMPVTAMAEALRGFRGDPESNPGRANLIEAGGLRILVDYAHNPHGLRALAALAASLPGARRLVLLGQAGDRDEESLRDLARAAWALKPDHVVVKELPELLRGRELGEVPAILEDELLRLGMPPEAISRTGSELEGVRRALDWARPGDVLLLLVHTQRSEVMEMLRGLR